MSNIQKQLRRASAAVIDLYTLAAGELGIDTTNWRLRAGDGVVAGGKAVFPNTLDIQKNPFTYAADSSGAANTITVTLSPVPASYAAGLLVWVKIANTVTGAAQININGLGNKALKKASGGALVDLVAGDLIAGCIYPIMYDGTQAQILGGVPQQVQSSGLVLLDVQTASSSAQLDFTSSITSAYEEYLFELSFIKPATGAGQLLMRLSTTATALFYSGSSDYYNNYAYNNSGAETKSAGLASAITVSQTPANSVDGYCGTVRLHARNGKCTLANYDGAAGNNVSGPTAMTNTYGSGVLRASSAQLDGVRFLQSGGNITSGTIRCYGKRPAV